jgi:hypothetical protein
VGRSQSEQRTDGPCSTDERPHLAHPARSAYARFLVFSARSGADGEGPQRVELTRLRLGSWRLDCAVRWAPAVQRYTGTAKFHPFHEKRGHRTKLRFG